MTPVVLLMATVPVSGCLAMRMLAGSSLLSSFTATAALEKGAAAMLMEVIVALAACGGLPLTVAVRSWIRGTSSVMGRAQPTDGLDGQALSS
jgi:hypothetical protein